MLDIECPTPAYRRIISSGLKDRINENKDKISDLLLMSSSIPIWRKEFKEIFNKAKNVLLKNEKISEKREIYKNILDFHTLN